jgi:hypothetical protein
VFETGEIVANVTETISTDFVSAGEISHFARFPSFFFARDLCQIAVLPPDGGKNSDLLAFPRG